MNAGKTGDIKLVGLGDKPEHIAEFDLDTFAEAPFSWTGKAGLTARCGLSAAQRC
ncbi:MAG: hypothetical protein ACYS21_13155 [Planctomycetota bacterium]